MFYHFVRTKLPAVALSILFGLSLCASLAAQQLTPGELYSVASLFDNGFQKRFFVINSPSTESAGADSILTFDSLGESSVFFGANHDLGGLRDIAVSPNFPEQILVSHNDFSVPIAELLEFNSSGTIVRRIPFGTPGEDVALAFDIDGNFYVAEGAAVFKNGVLFANLPDASEVGRLAVDRKGVLYLTKPLTSQLLRIDSLGNVTVFADLTQGLNEPFGLAVDGKGNIFVANNPPSAPGFILEFDRSGTSAPFAMDIAFQPSLSGMTFDRDKLYVVAAELDEILQFDMRGKSSIFAGASEGLKFPVAITDRHHRLLPDR